MSTNARVQVSLHRDSGLPEDDVVNAWHFEGDDPQPAGGSLRAKWDNDITGLAARLTTFYQDVGAHFGAILNGNATIKAYDMADPKPRIPRFQSTFTFVPSSTSLPAEVAVCLSFRAAAASGVPMARRRGRVYLGPLATGWADNTPSGGDKMPSITRRNHVLAAAKTMATGGSGTFRLAVFSPTIAASAGDTGDDAWNDVVMLSMDDAFDTQRRRGSSPTSRIELAV